MTNSSSWTSCIAFWRLIGTSLAMMLGLGYTFPCPSDALLLFDGGAPTNTSGLRISDIGPRVAAADFRTTAPWQVTRATFWSIEQQGFAWNGTVNYFIFNDGPAGPSNPPGSRSPSGSPLASGSGQSIVKTPDSRPLPSGFQYTFDFENPVQLAAGKTYWLGINLPGGGTFGTTQGFWASTDTPFQEMAALTGSDFGEPWDLRGLELAFQLQGTVVPGASTLLLLGASFAGLGVLRWRRERHTSSPSADGAHEDEVLQ